MIKPLLRYQGAVFPIFGGFWAAWASGVRKWVVEHVTYLWLERDHQITVSIIFWLVPVRIRTVKQLQPGIILYNIGIKHDKPYIY